MKAQKLSFEFPVEEHKYLKMCCAKLGMSIREFVTQAIIEKVDEQEDKWMVEQPGFLEGCNSSESISAEVLWKELGLV